MKHTQEAGLANTTLGRAQNVSTAIDDPRVAVAMHRYLEAMEAGRCPSREEFLAQYPDIATELSSCLDGLALVHAAARSIQEVNGQDRELTPDQLQLPLGDFRIIREIGRGGMGVVYEAVQLSLGRRVALKVLPLSAALDPKHLQRFKNEAQAAAQLHHTNIVPVYAVGSERGVHYYSMQLIEGYSLADLIEHRRQMLGKSAPSPHDPGNQPTEKAMPRPPIPPVPQPNDVTQGFVPAPPVAATVTRTRSSTFRTASERNTNTYFRTIAELFRQAALALEHAHQAGVIHRDIKPANLLLDENGNLWVTDFGLAQFQANMQLTRTGDMLGTLRYMSPEQAGGDRVVLDHRTDIYSLGITLYELLTLESAIVGDEPHTVLRRIIEQDPRPPRAVDKHIPAELETIVLKCLAKVPGERYTTAAALADDLERWLEDKPIQARRPTLVELASRWGRRNWALATVAAGILAVATLGLSLSTLLISMAHSDTRAAFQREKTQSEMTERQRELAERQKKAADESFRQARQAVDSFLQLSEEELAGKPALHETRRRFLANALTYYNDFLDKRRDDPEVREELAKSSQWAKRISDELMALERYASYLLLSNSFVQKDLNITSEQQPELKTQLVLLDTIDKSTGRESSEGASLTEQVRDLDGAISKILTAEQTKRLGQIALQQRGPFAFKSPEVAKFLSLTADQRKQINLIIEEETPGRRPGFDHGPPGEHGPPGDHGPPGEHHPGGGPRGFGPPPREWDDERPFDGKKGGPPDFGGPRGKGKGGPTGGKGGFGDFNDFGPGGPRGGKGDPRGERKGGPPGGKGGPGGRGGFGGEVPGGFGHEPPPPPPEFDGRPDPRGPKGGKTQIPGEFGPAMRRTVQRIVALLTETQRAKWYELVGPEFGYELPWRPE